MKRNIRLMNVLMAAVAGYALVVEAIDYTWTNNASGNWADSVMWSPNGVPGASDTAIFDNTTSSTTNKTITLGTSSVGTVNVTGSRPWTWTNGTLTVGNAFNYGSSDYSSFYGILAGNCGVNITTGRLTMSSSDNTYSGGTFVNGGRLIFAADSIGGGGGTPPNSGPIGTGTLTINSGSIAALASPRTIANQLILNGNFSVPGFGYTNLTLSGNATLSSNITITLSDTNVSSYRRLYLTGSIDDGGGNYGITIVSGHTQGEGIEWLDLTSANTFGGGVTAGGVETIQIVVSNNNALGTGPFIAATTPQSSLTAMSSGLVLPNAVRLDGNLNIGGWTGSPGSVVPFTLNGDITLTGNRSLSVFGSSAYTLNGSILSSGGPYTLTHVMGSTNVASYLTLGGSNKTHTAGIATGGATVQYVPQLTITGSNNTFIQPVMVNAGRIILSGVNNTFAGGIIINNNGVFYVSNATQIATGTITMNGTSSMMPVLNLMYNGLPEINSVSRDGVIAINTTGYNAITNLTGMENLYLGSSSTGTLASTELVAGTNATYLLGGGGGRLTIDRPSSTAGVLTGNNNVVVGRNGDGVNFSGVVTLADANDFTGTLTVNRGSELIGVAQASGQGSPFGASSSPVILNGGTLALTNASATTAREPVTKGSLTYSGAAKINLAGSSSAKAILTLASVTNDSIISGTYDGGLLVRGMNNSMGTNEQLFVTTRGPDLINDTYNMVSPRYVILTAANNGEFATYDETKGLVRLGFNETDINNADPGDIVSDGNKTVNSDKTMHALRFVGGVTGDGNLTGTGTLTITSGGIIGTGDGRRRINNPIVFPEGVQGVITTLATANGNTLTITNQIQCTRGILKLGPQRLTLCYYANPYYIPSSRPNMYGPIIVAEGSLTFNPDAQLGPTTNELVINGGVVDLWDYNFSIFRPIIIGPNGGTIYAYNPIRANYLYGKITGPGLLKKSGNQKLYFASSENDWSGGFYMSMSATPPYPNVYVLGNSSLGTGDVTVMTGTLTLYGAGNIGTNARLVMGGTTVNMMANNSSYVIGSLEGTGGSVVLGTNATGTVTLNVGGNNANTEFWGVIKDYSSPTQRGALIKNGSGIFRLNGVNTYTGPTIVSNGTLLVNGSIYTNAVTVCNGAKLGGSGTAMGTVTVETGGVLIPGDGVGTLRTGGLVLQNNAEIWYEFSGETNSDLIVTSDLTIGTSTNVILRLKDAGITKKPRGEYVVIQYSGTDPDLGKWVVNSEVEGVSGSVYLDTSNKRVMVRLMESGTIFMIY